MLKLRDLVGYLKSTKLLLNLENEEVYDNIAQNLHEKKFFKSEHIFMQNENTNNIYFVKKGEIEVYKTSNSGKKIIFNVLKEGDVFCLSAGITGRYLSNALSKKESILYRLDSKILNSLISKYNSFSQVVIHHIALRVAAFSVSLERAVLMDAFTCIISLIISLQKNNIVHSTQDEIASLSGICRETVSRLLKKLKESDCIYTSKGKICIKDLEKLKKFCE
jgi:CRP/FNR family transcriptional regulator